jgi:hypothetical protein
MDSTVEGPVSEIPEKTTNFGQFWMIESLEIMGCLSPTVSAGD